MRLRIWNDPRYFLETCCTIKDLGGNALVPFIFNTAQNHYYDNVWLAGLQWDIVGKARKWGFSTLRLGLGLHDAMFSEGRIFRLVAHKKDTSIELKATVDMLYESAKEYFESLGLDPFYFLPHLKFDNRNEYSFLESNSAVIVDTASGSGVGQSYRSDDLYLTEYSDWANAETSYEGLIGSMPLDNPYTRCTIDFNAHGIGNDAYRKFQAANRGENGYKSCFYGVLDCPEIYPTELVKERRASLGKRAGAVLPATEDEMWVWDDEAVFDYGDIQDCARDTYYRDRPVKGNVEYFHGVDTATGQKDGDWQVMKGFALVDGKLIEAYPPIRVREPEDVFARRVDKYARLFKGTVVVERNVGSAVITVLKEKGTPGLFRHKSRDKTGGEKRQIGFPMTYPAKRTMISEFSQMLRRREIELVSDNGREELRIFEWKHDSTGPITSRGRLAGAPDATGMYDDEAMATLLAVQGLKSRSLPVEVF